MINNFRKLSEVLDRGAADADRRAEQRDKSGLPRNIKVVMPSRVGPYAFGSPQILDAETGEPIAGLVQAITVEMSIDDFPRATVVFAGQVAEIAGIPGSQVECEIACKQCGTRNRIGTADQILDRQAELHNGSGFPVAIAGTTK